MICPKCEKRLLWGGEHDYDDEESGAIVGNYTCTNKECDVDSVYIYTKSDIDEV
jgi:hypothetical protein|tara:strand:- start:23109 stop:23270 length:162 start_codon:yes stop_codon:yes gene_type:complete